MPLPGSRLFNDCVRKRQEAVTERKERQEKGRVDRVAGLIVMNTRIDLETAFEESDNGAFIKSWS
jgi:hypothetical protein